MCPVGRGPGRSHRCTGFRGPHRAPPLPRRCSGGKWGKGSYLGFVVAFFRAVPTQGERLFADFPMRAVKKGESPPVLLEVPPPPANLIMVRATPTTTTVPLLGTGGRGCGRGPCGPPRGPAGSGGARKGCGPTDPRNRTPTHSLGRRHSLKHTLEHGWGHEYGDENACGDRETIGMRRETCGDTRPHARTHRHWHDHQCAHRRTLTQKLFRPLFKPGGFRPITTHLGFGVTPGGKKNGDQKDKR